MEFIEDDYNKSLYEAFKSKDNRFDGRFFVGIISTGVYCRPVCKAKVPKFENCKFFKTAAEAEIAGFRPCLLCRPELAPGNAPVDSVRTLADNAVKFIEQNCTTIESTKEIADYLGCSDRHLRRIFSEVYNVSPLQYLQTSRLHLAKTLLTDTALSVTDIAIISGFSSVRRFNDLLKKQYHLTPTEIRMSNRRSVISRDVNLSLGYRPPYKWAEILEFLRQRSIPSVEKVIDGKYIRTVKFLGKNNKLFFGCIKIENNSDKNCLDITIDENLVPVLPKILAKIRQLFDLDSDPDIISEKLFSMNKVKKNMFEKGLRIPGCFDPFELCVRTVLGQQITVKAATTLAGRFVEKFGTYIKTEEEGLKYLFPEPEQIVAVEKNIEDELGALGIISSRAKSILAIAKMFVNQSINFDFCTDPEKEIEKLKELPGIGSWSANYIAMRAMGYTDAFLETDYGIKKVLKPFKPQEILKLSMDWRPWRSYATVNIWNTLLKK